MINRIEKETKNQKSAEEVLAGIVVEDWILDYYGQSFELGEERMNETRYDLGNDRKAFLITLNIFTNYCGQADETGHPSIKDKRFFSQVEESRAKDITYNQLRQKLIREVLSFIGKSDESKKEIIDQIMKQNRE